MSLMSFFIWQLGIIPFGSFGIFGYKFIKGADGALCWIGGTTTILVCTLIFKLVTGR